MEKFSSKAPACRNVIGNDITYRVTTQSIIPAANIGFAATETHVADDHIMGIHPKGFACYANAIAGSVWPSMVI
jgi:hypothetical protein